MLEVWQRLDAALGELVAAAGDGATVVVLSDHGSGPVHREFRVLNWLLREGYSDRDLRRARVLTFQPYGGELFVHDRRFPEGIVEDAERAALIDEIASRLGALRDSGSAEPVLGEIHRTEGDGRAARAGTPDLLFEGAPGWLVARGKGLAESPIFGPPSYTFSGYHLPEGILVVAGPGAAAGTRVEGARLVDIAPTLLYLAGAAVPTGLDGRVVTSLFTAERLSADPPRLLDVDLERSSEEIEAIEAVPYIR
jgi:predicted AlkP superfamily phosphohydrolase/phosphomutase